MVYQVMFKVGYREVEFYFTDINEACSFMGTAVEHLDGSTENGRESMISMKAVKLEGKGLDDVQM